MTQQARPGPATSPTHEGADFVCCLCGCEVMVKRWGEPRAHAEVGVFVCHCGATMRPEHPGQIEAGRGERPFNTDDFLSQGSGVGGPGAGTTTPPDTLADGVL